MSRYPAVKLLNVSRVLSKLYYSTNDEQKNAFLRLVVEEKAFVYFVIQLSCKVMQLDDGKLMSWNLCVNYLC